MSLLTPLYVAGLLAISLPILFHLIRRTPHGRREFSSLMFLTPSPPRITRRSRLSNIFLLILRALALTLLAFAFGRPFLFNDAQADLTVQQGRRLAILVDVSASMQRGDLRQQATREVDRVLDGLDPRDEVGLFVFDRQVRPAMTFEEWNQTNPAQRAAMLRGRLSETQTTWSGTNIGSALATVADQLADVRGSEGGAADRAARQIVLITDLQQGGHAEALQAHQWPDTVALEVRRVELAGKSNASLQVVRDRGDASATAGETQLRVRVSNQPDSIKEQFTVSWAGANGPISGIETVSVYVAPGRSQIVRIPWPHDNPQADRLMLSGDDVDFDNTLYTVPLRVDSVRVVYIGDDTPTDTNGLRFYFEKAAVPTPLRKVEVVAHRQGGALAVGDLAGARLVVITMGLADAQVGAIQQFIEQGGSVLWVLRDVNAAQGLSRITQNDSINSQEATGGKFVLISRVNLDHPIFAPFSDVRFSDFTKIHFWKHRQITATDLSAMKPIAWFDDGDPFMLEQGIGRGRLLVMTAGWQPADSQLALSTKFVPLMDRMLARRDGALVEAQYSVDEPIALPPVSGQQSRSITGPDGTVFEVPTSANVFDSAKHPGIYRLRLEGGEIPLAINLPPDESRTAPLAVEDLEQWGAQLGKKPISEQVIAKQQQLQVVDLENKQKLWRWGIVAVLGLLVMETVVAGRLAHRGRQSLEERVTT